MKAKAFWELFQDTGDPLCYLLYRSVRGAAAARPEKKDGTAGKSVRRPA